MTGVHRTFGPLRHPSGTNLPLFSAPCAKEEIGVVAAWHFRGLFRTFSVLSLSNAVGFSLSLSFSRYSVRFTGDEVTFGIERKEHGVYCVVRARARARVLREEERERKRLRNVCIFESSSDTVRGVRKLFRRECAV